MVQQLRELLGNVPDATSVLHTLIQQAVSTPLQTGETTADPSISGIN